MYIYLLQEGRIFFLLYQEIWQMQYSLIILCNTLLQICIHGSSICMHDKHIAILILLFVCLCVFLRFWSIIELSHLLKHLIVKEHLFSKLVSRISLAGEQSNNAKQIPSTEFPIILALSAGACRGFSNSCGAKNCRAQKISQCHT